MTEIDVDMAIFTMGQAVADLVAASQDSDARSYVEANRERLLADIGRLSESLAAMREPIGAAAPSRSAGLGAKRLRNLAGPHHRRPSPGVRTNSRLHAG